MKQEKGFTLIELLTVIVILAVIALIATPLIMGTITNAKKNSFVDTTYGILKAAENYQAMKQVENDGNIPYLLIQDLETDESLKYKGAKPKAGKVMINTNGESTIVTWNGQFCAKKHYMDSKIKVIEHIDTKEDCMNLILQTTTFDYTGNVQTYTIPKTGTYLIELWGAEGGSQIPSKAFGGKGAYVNGMITLNQGEKIYIYVGEHPTMVTGLCYEENKNNSFNASTVGACIGGGGATDIRLESGAWNDFHSLKSRIMVAAGGGGAFYRGTGGYAGAFTGASGVGFDSKLPYQIGSGGTQTIGYAQLFGIAGRDTTIGGGGYYGGYGGSAANAGGGSSFISGYSGCDAIHESSSKDGMIHTGQPNHYSGKIFTNGTMISGNDSMPNPRGVDEIVGNEGNGFAKITFISSKSEKGE